MVTVQGVVRKKEKLYRGQHGMTANLMEAIIYPSEEEAERFLEEGEYLVRVWLEGGEIGATGNNSGRKTF